MNAWAITAGVWVNDAEDGLLQDIDEWLETLAPFRSDYRHHRTGETNGDSHLKNLLAITPQVEKGYAVVRREWKKGDRVELVLPLVPQLVTPSDKIAATRGRVALRYGPLIYSAESVDQDITKVLSPDARLTTEWNPFGGLHRPLWTGHLCI